MAEEKQNQEQEKATQASPPSKGMMKWIVLAVLIVVLGGGGFAGWSYMSKPQEKSPKGGGAEKAREVKKEETVKEICPLDSFIVNLMDKSSVAKRYLKVTMALEVGAPEIKLKIDRDKTQLRDTIILLLSSQGFQDISTVEGKLGLKQEILSRVNQVLGPGAVTRVYFTEFVVQ
jgi:flagellar FliL protein